MLATSNLVRSWSLPRPIIKSHPEEKWYGNSPKFRVSFNISVMAKAGDFKFGKSLGFAKFNYKITPKVKSGRGPRLVTPENLGFRFNIFAMAETSDFKFSTQFGFAN